MRPSADANCLAPGRNLAGAVCILLCDECCTTAARYLCFVLYRFLMDGLGSRAIWLMKYDTSVIVDLYCIVNKVASKIICEISSNLRDLKLNYCDFDQG